MFCSPIHCDSFTFSPLLPREGVSGALKASPNSVFSSFIDEIVTMFVSLSAPEMALFPYFAEGLNPNQTHQRKTDVNYQST